MPDESQRKADSKQIIEELDLPDGYAKTPAEMAEVLHVPPTDIILCGLTFTLDMKSHTWIYRFHDPNRFSHSILFRWSDHDQNPDRREGEERTMEVFRETISKDKLLRTVLTREEALGELAEVEQYLMEFVGEETYRFYYHGGKLEEPEPEIVDLSSSDPFEEVEPKSEEELREQAKYLNHMEAWKIANEIQGYRSIIEAEAHHATTTSRSVPMISAITTLTPSSSSAPAGRGARALRSAGK